MYLPERVFDMDSGELPEQTLLQQRHARPVSGEELEVFGKHAASRYLQGEFETLSAAVVETVKHAELSPEQVRRVVEFTNQSAYLEEFRKEGAHRIVSFAGGPADPSVVIKDLNDGGGGTVFDRGLLDYSMPPDSRMKTAAQQVEGEKTASAAPAGEEFNPYDDVLFATLGGGQEPKIAYADPYKPLKDCHDKLAGASEQLESDLSSLEVDYADVTDRLYQEVKQAAMAGTALGDVVAAWAPFVKTPAYVKVAFQLISPRLWRERVFDTLHALDESLHKVGSDARVPNPDHPLVVAFNHYTEVLDKLASVRALKGDIDDGLAKTEALLKQAVGGALGKAWKGLGTAGHAVGDVAGQAGKVLFDADPKQVSKMVGKGVQYGGAGLGVLGANAALQEVTDRPVAQGAISATKAVIPGTQEYNMRRYRLQSGM